MKMSAACTAPSHAPLRADDRQHPLYPEYLRYRDAMSAQLARCQSFASWVSQIEND